MQCCHGRIEEKKGTTANQNMQTWSMNTNTHFLVIFLLLRMTCATGSVILSPQWNYTVFQSHNPAIFICSGDGTIAVWTLNGNSSSGSGVTITPYDPTLGAIVPSHLSIIPYPTYNNTQLVCAVVTYQPTLRFVLSSPTLLIVQGPLDVPSNFCVNISNTSNTTFLFSWGAPFSLDVTDSPDIFYYTLCTNITIYECRNISSDPDCTFPRTCTSSVDFTVPSLNGTNGGQNKTIMDYGNPIHFTFFAVNGAGNGSSAYTTYPLFPLKKGPNASSSLTEATAKLFDPTNPSTPAGRAYNQTSAIVGCIIGGVAIVAFSLVISVILCAKRNARHKPVPVNANVMCSIQTPLKEETDYFVTLDTFVHHLQHHSGSESGNYQQQPDHDKNLDVTPKVQVSITLLPADENVCKCVPGNNR